MSAEVLLSVRGRVAVVTLNRPQVRNALSGEALKLLYERLDEAFGAPDVRAVVLTGAGPAFCAGDDLREAAGLDENAFAGTVESWQRITEVMLRSPVPVIAAINGPAIGGGLEITLACDVRVASSAAFFACPEVSLGLTATNGASVLLPALIGMGRASEMLIGGRRHDADWALSAGLVSAVVAPNALEPHAMELAELIASHSPAAVRLTRDLLRSPSAPALREALEQEANACVTAFRSSDSERWPITSNRTR
ncbi:enoyl-CoA hydratase/isomerase family protein [Actinomadura barringtoniae]|uniref:Enoyl-CoA hydratase/isomerase family protein n=1 Tax=Actinomadura barringtoniae TaxID=1427535 RepID=A0A939P7H8_9ACTN|nr:enoyl-CoA hydratase/isomerase family protein [Actinomadura barringtoniae]MBO2446522.1 enoyl-CoA hydratase/isomerase family protein [Actinomadura barringtoniae]